MPLSLAKMISIPLSVRSRMTLTPPPCRSSTARRPWMISTASRQKKMLDILAAMLSATIAAPLAGVVVTLAYSFCACAEPSAGMIAGVMVRDVVPPPATTRKVCNCPVDCLVSMFTANTPAIVNASPFARVVLLTVKVWNRLSMSFSGVWCWLAPFTVAADSAEAAMVGRMLPRKVSKPAIGGSAERSYAVNGRPCRVWRDARSLATLAASRGFRNMARCMDSETPCSISTASATDSSA